MERQEPELRISYPHLIPANEGCVNCSKKNPSFTMNSAILTIVIGSLSFLVAFSWNQFVKESFERITNKREELRAMFIYAISLTFFAIMVAFVLMFYLNGTKW